MIRKKVASGIVGPALVAVSLGIPASAQTVERLPPVPAIGLTDAQKAAVAEFTAARGREISGPFKVLLRSPELMTRARAMGDYLRYRTLLPPRLSEFVILITARQWTQQYEWGTHAPIAIEAGLDPGIVQALAEGRRPEGMREDESALYDFCTELHTQQSVTDQTYARMLAAFGERGIVDAVGIAGYYTFLAMLLNTAGTPAPEGDTPPLRALPR